MQLPPASTVPMSALANQYAVCGRSVGGLKLHMKAHGVTATTTTAASSLCCHLCHKLCKSQAGLKSHLRAHGRSQSGDEEEKMTRLPSDKTKAIKVCVCVCVCVCVRVG